MRKCKTKLFFFILLMVVFFGVGNYSFVTSEDTLSFDEKRILFISSYSSSFPTFHQQIEGLRESFEEYPVILDIEFMDSKRFFTQENEDNFRASLEYKLQEINYDLLIVSDDNATNFAIDHKDDLFSGLPIIFFGVNNIENATSYASLPNVTGVIEDISYEETLSLALMLNPDADKVVGLFDATPTGQSDLLRFQEIATMNTDIRFSVLDLSTMTMNDYVSRISEIKEDTIIILFSVLRDGDGTNYEFHESTRLLLDNSQQPIYHLFEHGVEDGLLGGKVVSHKEQAKQAAKMAITFFQGKDIADIDLVSKSPNVCLINYEAFKSFGFNESKLPNDVIFVNRDYSFFEQYTIMILGISILVSIQTFVIILLHRAVRNRNKAQKDLEIANDQLSYNAYHDYLTGIYNRNYFEIQFPKLEEKRSENVSIVLIDVNGLKLINDAFGHIKGDKALTTTARLINETFRKSDVFRIGGDEFAVLSLGRSEQDISILINTLNRKVQREYVEGVPLSLSIGYAELTQGKSINEMFTEAEDWMYREKLNQVPSNRSAIIDTIIATINQKDVYSENHSKRVSVIATRIAEFLNRGDKLVSEIKTAGLLHDIGKIIIPSHILNKTGKLSDEEYEEIKKHSEIGYRILNSVSSMRDISEYVFCHHERPDGLGYPRGLKGDEIPLQSKIIAVADAIDAMLTDRLYRDRLSKTKCYNELKNNSGTQFDKEVVDVTLKNFDEIYQILEEQY